jgi:hypothetical protein
MTPLRSKGIVPAKTGFMSWNDLGSKSVNRMFARPSRESRNL